MFISLYVNAVGVVHILFHFHVQLRILYIVVELIPTMMTMKIVVHHSK